MTTQTIALKNAVPDILRTALAACGWIITSEDEAGIAARCYGQRLTWSRGRGLSFTTQTVVQAEAARTAITQAYSKAAVSWAAQRAGWTVQSTGANTMTINRR